MKRWAEHPTLAKFLLEESYVLDFQLHPGRLVFAVDFALDRSHSEYQGPAAGEAYDFRLGQLIFGGLGSCNWESTNGTPTRDSDGTLDWGAFDSVMWEGDRWQLEGDFGLLDLLASTVDVQLEAGRSQR